MKIGLIDLTTMQTYIYHNQSWCYNLQELGGKISSALQQMTNATIVNEDVFNECLKEIVRALIQNDVQVEINGDLQVNRKRIINFDGRAEGHDKRKIIQQV